MDGKEESGYGYAVNVMKLRIAPTMAVAPPVNMTEPYTELEKKRGRPRKFGQDGPMAAALSPMPISASIPLSEDFSRCKQPKMRRFWSIRSHIKCSLRA